MMNLYNKNEFSIKWTVSILLLILVIILSGCREDVPKTQTEAPLSPQETTLLDITSTPSHSEPTSTYIHTTTQMPTTPTFIPTPTPTHTPTPTPAPTPTTIPTPTPTEETTNIFDGYMEYGDIDVLGNEIEKENVLRTGFIEVKPNTVYTLSTLRMGDPFVTGGIIEYDGDKNYVCQTLSGGKVFPYTFVTRGETKYIRWHTTESIYARLENVDYAEYWLEEGNESTPWNKILESCIRDIPKSQGVENTLKRLSYFCDTFFETNGKGMVIGYIDPLKTGKPNPYTAVSLDKYSKIYGMPYSSLRKTDSYVGFEVSLDTYMTALYNPASIMYTKNLQDPSCEGYSPFIYYVWNPYGAVCSTVVGYSLGLDIRYSTYEWSEIEGMDKVDLSADEIQLGDVLCNVTSKNESGGHMAMITDIIRDEQGSILYVRITEAGIPTMLHSYVFYNYFKNIYLSSYSVYRYRYIDSVPQAANGYIDGTIEYNAVLALDRGDKSVYSLGSSVEVNLLDKNIESLEIELLNETRDVYTLLFTLNSDKWTGKNVGGEEYTVCSFIPDVCGKYRLSCKMNDGSRSDYLYFILADSGEVSLDIAKGQSIKPNEEFTVMFSGYSACTPLYVCIETDKYVTRSQRMLTEEEIINGEAVISYYGTGKCYVKIYYQNEFGRICSVRQAVEFK